MKNRGKLLIVSGPSGVGKGTILKQLLKNSEFPLVLSVSATTRSPRPGEVNEVDYHFLSRNEFENRKKNGEFIECFQVFKGGDWYGTLRSTIDTALEKGDWLILEIDLKGARKVLETYPDAITIFIEPPSLAHLADRLEKRGTENQIALQKRLRQASEEIEDSRFYQYKVVNDNLDQAVEDFRRLLKEIE